MKQCFIPARRFTLRPARGVIAKLTPRWCRGIGSSNGSGQGMVAHATHLSAWTHDVNPWKPEVCINALLEHCEVAIIRALWSFGDAGRKDD
jgi:hypothetical protein